MNSQANNIEVKPKQKPHNKRPLLIMAGVLVACIVGIIFYLYSSGAFNNISKKQGTSQKPTPYTEGPGGDPKLVTSYHSQALQALKAGDKQKAKELAQKGLEANQQLTATQQEELPDQANVVISLTQIQYGARP